MITKNFLWITSFMLWIFVICDGYHIIRARKVQPKFEFRHHYPIPQTTLNHFTKPSATSTSLESQLILNDIREAFRIIQQKKSNANEFMNSIFKQSILNPKYIFQIPHKGNKKIIIRRSDFVTPNYPNLTTTYMKLAHMSLSSKPYKNDSPIIQKEEDYQKELTWLADLNFADEHFEELHNKVTDVVEANVVTEMNFVNYIKKLNSKGENYLKKQNNFINNYAPPTHLVKFTNKNHKKTIIGRKVIPKIRLALPPLQDSEWKDLGLEGWEGELSLPKYSNPTFEEISEIDSVKKDQDIYKIQIPGQYDFFDNDEKNNVWDLPGKVSSAPLQYLIENYNDETLKNMSILFTKDAKPEWPITNSRNAHKDDDVYIARANDPFGHSTKWNLSNSSSNGIIKEDRRKRAVVELYSMIKCSTGCDPLIFKGYGCFCGFMGSGIPVDGIDRCCKMHDKCYGYSNCPSYLEYFVPYIWKCYQGKPLCAIDHGEWGGPGSCADRLCKCDMQFSRCLRQFYCPRKRAVCRTSAIRMLQNFLMIL